MERHSLLSLNKNFFFVVFCQNLEKYYDFSITAHDIVALSIESYTRNQDLASRCPQPCIYVDSAANDHRQQTAKLRQNQLSRYCNESVKRSLGKYSHHFSEPWGNLCSYLSWHLTIRLNHPLT